MPPISGILLPTTRTGWPELPRCRPERGTGAQIYRGAPGGREAPALLDNRAAVVDAHVEPGVDVARVDFGRERLSDEVVVDLSGAAVPSSLQTVFHGARGHGHAHAAEDVARRQQRRRGNHSRRRSECAAHARQ